MIITAIGDWRPRPGTLWECHPTLDARGAAGQAPVHPAPTTFLQEGHLRAALARIESGQRHTAYTGVATEMDGEFDGPAFARVARAFTLRHEALRCWFEVDDGAVVRHLVSEDAVEFTVGPVAECETDTQFQAYVANRFSQEASPVGWPGFALGAVVRPGSFTLYYGADHAFTDGASQALAVSELADLYLFEIGGTAIEPESSERGSHLDYAVDERERSAGFGPDSTEIRDWLSIFAEHGNKMPKFPLHLGLSAGETAPVLIMGRQLLTAAETAAFDHECKAAGSRMSSGVFAAVAITDYELAGIDNYFGITVLSTRHLGDYAQSQGWFVNFAPVAFSVADAHTFADVAASAHAGFERAKKLAAAPVHAVLGALAATGVPMSEISASPNLLSYIDFRWFPGVGRPADQRGVHFTGEGSTANASMWINRDADHLYLVAQVPDIPIAVEAVGRYHAHIENVIRSVATTGTYAISQSRHVENRMVDASHHH